MTRIILYILFLLITVSIVQADVVPATPIKGHAHNDYLHKNPLFDALDNGFCSVEADVFFVKDLLLVGHFGFQLSPARSLENMYLKPLRDHIRQSGGKIFPDTDTFYLWIELKTDAAVTYAALHKLLEKYADILTRYENGQKISGAVTVILTGNARLALIRNAPKRYAAVDGFRYALDSDVSPYLVPTVSLNWREEFPQFKGRLTAAEQAKLAEQVRKAHERNRKLRYWNTPDQEYFWQILDEAGVDLINTDRLAPLREFLMQKNGQ